MLDVAIIGAGVSGISAAMEAARAGLSYCVFEATQTFSTVANFPKGKPIFTYPTDMTPVGGIQYSAADSVKEALLESMERQRKEAGIEVTPARIERVPQCLRSAVLPRRRRFLRARPATRYGANPVRCHRAWSYSPRWSPARKSAVSQRLPSLDLQRARGASPYFQAWADLVPRRDMRASRGFRRQRER